MRASAKRSGYTYSFDMLGEAALTADDAQRFFEAYEAAIHAIGKASAGRGVVAGPGVSVKLSALHPRYSRAQRARVMAELAPRVLALMRLSKHYDIGFAIDAEEADRLEISLDVLAALIADPALADWDGLGFVVQAYQKRARPGDRLARRAGAAAPAAPDAAPRQGRVLGFRDQARAGRRHAGLSGIHAQGAHRRRVSRVREGDAGGAGRALLPVRHAQRIHDRGDPHALRRRALRVPVPARDGREHLRPARRRAASSTARAGSTRRSARTRRCSPISSGGCSRTAPTRRSSTASSIRRFRSPRWSRIPSRRH